MTATDTRPRNAVILALAQSRYQLLLLIRSPMGFFLTLVVPVLLLVALNLLTPDTLAQMPRGMHYSQFLTPALGAFCLLSTCYVNTVTGIVLAREEGVLKRLRGTPLPAWTYFVGRFGSALATAATGIAVITLIGVLFFDVSITGKAIWYLSAAAALGAITFFLLGVAVTTAVPKSDTALPVAFGTMLPLAFISDVFFSSSHAPAWLRDLASALPIAPVARAMEAAFNPSTSSWPMSTTDLLTLALWNLAAVVAITFTFRWEPGSLRSALHWPFSR